jgi:hypothetical protein
MENKKPTEPPTVVLFRKDRSGPHKGTVIAVFPEIVGARNEVSYYVHVGQHASAPYHNLISTTAPASPEEYASLKRELESEPYRYNLTVRAKTNNKIRAAYQAQHEVFFRQKLI